LETRYFYFKKHHQADLEDFSENKFPSKTFKNNVLRLLIFIKKNANNYEL